MESCETRTGRGEHRQVRLESDSGDCLIASIAVVGSKIDLVSRAKSHPVIGGARSVNCVVISDCESVTVQ